MARLTAPGNFLLLGEYAVLEEGGLGVAVALERRLEITVRGAPSLTITGTTGRERYVWPPGSSGSLIDNVVSACEEEVKPTTRVVRELQLHFDIDSSRFHEKDRGKSGYGSSAAVATGLSFALLRSAGFGTRGLVAATFRAALGAHRRFQGGRGSGYDIAATLHGGVTLFSGGATPSVTHLSVDWLPPLALFSGERPVRTSDAIGRYLRWRRLHSQSAAHFLSESNRCVEGFAASASWEEAATWFEACRDLGVWLGTQIGVAAEIAPPVPADFLLWKAVGAGNELGVLCLASPSARAGSPPGEGSALSETSSSALRRVEIAETGVNWIEAEETDELE